MKIVGGITYLEPGEKHPNADKTDKKKASYRIMENRTTARSGYSTKSHLRRIVQKGYY